MKIFFQEEQTKIEFERYSFKLFFVDYLGKLMEIYNAVLQKPTKTYKIPSDLNIFVEQKLHLVDWREEEGSNQEIILILRLFLVIE